MGTLKPPPTSVSNGETVTVGRSEYQAVVFDTAAFPAGTLKVALFVPAPASTLAPRSCASVRLAAWGNVAHHIAARFKPYRHTTTTCASCSRERLAAWSS